MKSIFSKKIASGYIVIIALVSSLATYFITNHINNTNKVENAIDQSITNQQANTETSNNASCNYDVKRLRGYGFIKPLLFVDNKCEGEKLEPIKQKITSLIDDLRKSGTINTASVYLKDYSHNEWMSVNENEKYKPGSLLKVPELITFLRMNEEKPGILDKKVTYSHTYTIDKKPKYLSKSIKLGSSYTIRELLNYMIAYSDNNATLLLNDNIDVPTFKKVFTDIGLAAPDWKSSEFPITAKDYSCFMRVLYNASYLTIDDSEYATQLLSKCDFKEGMVKGFPENTKMAHKFGESGDQNEQQLHESAIIYINDKPFLLTIMTKGSDPQKLPGVISQIASTINQQMNVVQNTL